MTALAAWIAYSDLGPTSAYIATDSRISWTTAAKWDIGKKCFASLRFPDIFGYVGEVLLPSLLLGQVCCVLDSGGVVKTSSLGDRQKLVADSVQHAVLGYPNSRFRPFTIVHVGRDDDAEDGTEFQISLIDVDRARNVQKSRILSHNRASVLHLGGQKFVRSMQRVHVAGSGAALVNGFREGWNETKHAHTSRTIFSSLCEAISANRDPAVGGPAQLVGLMRKGAGQTYGFLGADRSPSVAGMPIADTQPLSQRLIFKDSNFRDVTRTGRARR